MAHRPIYKVSLIFNFGVIFVSSGGYTKISKPVLIA